MELRGFGDRTMASQRLYGPSLSKRLLGSPTGWEEVGPEAYRSALLLQRRLGSLLEEHAGSQLSQQIAVCPLQCRSGPESLVDLRPTARWRQQPRSHPHRMEPVRLCPDWMHSKHLGTDAYILASVLAIIVFRKM